MVLADTIAMIPASVKPRFARSCGRIGFIGFIGMAHLESRTDEGRADLPSARTAPPVSSDAGGKVGRGY
jgi:hypothetical protein